MKTASMVLGIIGGTLIFFFAIIFLFFPFASMDFYYGWDSTGTAVFLVFGIGGLILSALGIIGGALAKSHRITAGVLLIIDAVLCMVSLVGIVPGIMFLIAAIFAFVKEQPPAQRPYQQPYYQQPQYYYRQPQQPPYPQQPQQPQQPKPPQDKF